MSLPLWEECAWYVDYGDEVEAETEENHEEQQITTEQVAESIEDEYIPINIVDDHEIVSIGIATPGVGEGLHDPICPGTNAIVGEDVGEESTEEQHTEADPVIGGADGTEANNTHTSDVEDVQNDVPPKEATAEKGVVEEEHSTEISIEIVESDEDSEPPKPTYKFPISRSINRRMYLYLGEIYKLPCDAIVVGQVESLTDKNDGNDVIFTLAGIELEPELVSMAPCTTGDSVVTRGWQMPCEWIIHAVGPKYDERYLNASDHALFSAYKSALLLATEKEVQSLVIGTVYKQSKKYPRFEAAHVALRTVRKYLEHSVGDSLDRVMFCVNTQEDFEIYSALMHAYFPRSEEELQDQLNLLPIELGDEWGEIIIADRVVKVSSGPQPLPAESLQQYKGSQEEKDTTNTPPGPVKLGIRDVKPVGVMPRSMTQCDSDPDYARRKKVAEEFANMSKEERLRLRFQAMVRSMIFIHTIFSLFFLFPLAHTLLTNSNPSNRPRASRRRRTWTSWTRCS